MVDLSEDLRHVDGELKVRLRWTKEHKLDYIALDTSAQVPLKATKLPLLSAEHSRKGDVKDLLSKSDNRYAVMVLNDTIDLTFTAPETRKGSHTFIIQTEGNYIADEFLVNPANASHRLLQKDLKLPGNRGILYHNPVPEF